MGDDLQVGGDCLETPYQSLPTSRMAVYDKAHRLRKSGWMLVYATRRLGMSHHTLLCWGDCLKTPHRSLPIGGGYLRTPYQGLPISNKMTVYDMAHQLNGPNWIQQKRNTIEGDKHICQVCGGMEIEYGGYGDRVHHATPFRYFGLYIAHFLCGHKVCTQPTTRV